MPLSDLFLCTLYIAIGFFIGLTVTISYYSWNDRMFYVRTGSPILFAVFFMGFAAIFYGIARKFAAKRREISIGETPIAPVMTLDVSSRQTWASVMRVILAAAGGLLIFLAYMVMESDSSPEIGEVVTVISTLGLGTFFLFIPWGLDFQRLRRMFFWVLGITALTALVIGFLLASLNTGHKQGRGRSNARRIADIKQLQLALELYFDEYKSYPGAHGVCTLDAQGGKRAYGLESLAPKFIPTLPADPAGGCYRYATPPLAGTATATAVYHLGAVLGSSDNPSFQYDRDCNSARADGCALGYPPYINGFDGSGDTQNRLYDVTP